MSSRLESGSRPYTPQHHRLFDPFHVRDYQNIFSAIDSRAIDGVEVYTGGFPVRFGDRMSGVVLMESRLVDSEPRVALRQYLLTTNLDYDLELQEGVIHVVER